MRERILEALARIEREQGCQILFACESGSRAWGFASPDSDYDVRFIYTHTIDWHLRLEAKRDSIELMTGDSLDLSGWELAKTLRLFAGCNLALNEWIGSPEVYRSEPEFITRLAGLIGTYFNPRRALHHYLSMAAKTADQEISDEQVRIKKLFYILRPLLACHWILERGEMPPTRFGDLLRQPIEGVVAAEIGELLGRKALAREGEVITLPPDLRVWIGETSASVAARAATAPVADRTDWEPLDDLMRRWTPAKRSTPKGEQG